MIPQIEFRYSRVYDEKYRLSKSIQKYLKEKNKEYPSRKEIEDYIRKVKKLWKKEEKKIIKGISNISGLKWKEKRIICYVIGCGRAFSDPLTIGICSKNIRRFIRTLTHELIHEIQRQNREEYLRWYKEILKKYSKEKRTTKNHILLSAIHWILLERFYGKKELKKEMKKYNKFPDYKKAWKIVEEAKPENIIKKFKHIIKSKK